MIAFAGAVYILAQAAKVFGSPEAQAGFGSMAIAAAGLAIITVALVGLSTLITTASPVLIPAIGIMLGFAASLLAVGFASKLFGEGIQLMAGVDLLSTAVGIYALSGAVLAFGASMAVGGMASFLGGGMLLQLMGLAAMGPLLLMSATSLQAIGETLEMFTNNAIADGIDTITESIKGLNKELNNMNLLNLVALASVGKGVGGGGGATNDEVVSKLDELITLMKNGGIVVNIDGTKVSTAVAVATKFRGTA